MNVHCKQRLYSSARVSPRLCHASLSDMHIAKPAFKWSTKVSINSLYGLTVCKHVLQQGLGAIVAKYCCHHLQLVYVH